MSFDFVDQIETQVLKSRCVGLRRAVNHKALDDPAKIKLFVLGDVAKQHMDTCIKLFVKHMHMDELQTCMYLETKGFVTLPRMIHYMDNSKEICHKALREVLLEWVWPKVK
jgi:hypothetical protein